MKNFVWLGVALTTIFAIIGFAGSTGRASADTTGQLKWSGDVDDTAIVYVHNDQVRVETVSGKAASTTHENIVGRMPHGRVDVRIVGWNGRGSVTVLHQPRRENDFTAAIEINDPQAGYGHYHFTLEWNHVDGGYWNR